MHHLFADIFIRIVAYPILYWIGYGVTKGLSLGRANILPFSDLDHQEDAAWWEFRVRRYGYRYWLPQSMVLFGGLAALLAVSGYCAYRYL